MVGIDVLLLCPFEPPSGVVMESLARTTMGGKFYLPLVQAMAEFEARTGRSLDVTREENRPIFSDGERLGFPTHRSLTAVALATVLERAGLSWRVLDPGMQDIGAWRSDLERMRAHNPRVVGVSTTYCLVEPWVSSLIALVREIFPEATVVVGGYYYGTNTSEFLSFDADVHFIGEGEVRFPRLVRAIVEGRSYADIEGLCIRTPDGSLKFTGRAEPLDLAEHSLPDWSLAERVDPPISLERDFVEMGLETQRGCVFKCTFCTYRTLSNPSIMSAEAAVERIMSMSVMKRAAIVIHDATGTFPHERWQRICELLAKRGGAPHPVWAFARANDINDERTAELMERANVRMLFVGQESGDQRMLNLMKKGTRVAHVAPAVDRLARHGVAAHFGFLHGHPGENEESIRATRRLLATLNVGHEDNVPVITYSLNPFGVQDFASASADEGLTMNRHHALGYRTEHLTAEDVCNACMQTVIETALTPNAPVLSFIFGKSPSATGVLLGIHPRRQEAFVWMKLIERGVGLFLNELINGVAPSQADIDEICRGLDKFHGPLPVLRGSRVRAKGLATARFLRQLYLEWLHEEERGMGALTRLLIFAATWYDTGALPRAATAWRDKAYPLDGGHARRRTPAPEQVEQIAQMLISNAKTEARTAKLPILNAR